MIKKSYYDDAKNESLNCGDIHYAGSLDFIPAGRSFDNEVDYESSKMVYQVCSVKNFVAVRYLNYGVLYQLGGGSDGSTFKLLHKTTVMNLEKIALSVKGSL